MFLWLSGRVVDRYIYIYIYIFFFLYIYIYIYIYIYKVILKYLFSANISNNKVIYYSNMVIVFILLACITVICINYKTL